MAFQPSHPHAFGYDMSTTHLNYDTPQQQQQSNSSSDFYRESKIADQAINNVGMMAPESQNIEFRKDSLASNSGVLSPIEGSSWEHKQLYSNAAFDPSRQYHQTENAGFIRHDQTPVFSHAPQEWIMSPSGSLDPTGFEGFPTKFETSPFPQNVSLHSRDQPNFTSLQQDNGFGSGSVHTPAQTPISPESNTDWMALAHHDKEIKSEAKRLKPRQQPIMRRDGIRKKNAKIPIPSDITLETIDELIENCTDEDDMKQLKSQKRLLRNREAALASRQRKKKHTELLERKEKDLEGRIMLLMQQVEQLKLQLENTESQKHFFMEEQSKAQEVVQTLHFEKEDLICKHTQETGNLRHQVRVLREQLESSPAPAMSAAPSSAGFTDFGLEMDSLQLEDHPWDHFINVHDTSDMGASESFGNTADSFATIRGKPLNRSSQQETADKNGPVDQPVASGILFMLLLCGAFVASKSATTTSHPAIPRMPDEVRAASTEVLNNLLKDNPTEASMFMPELTQMHGASEPQISGQSSARWASPASSNRIGSLHERLTSPSKAQEAEQAFHMTPAQYNAMTQYPDMDESRLALPQRPTHRRNLADALKSMREQSVAKGGMAEVYTRSLLWDQIPDDVVRRFRQMVAESRDDEARTGDGGDDQEMHDENPSHETYELTQ